VRVHEVNRDRARVTLETICRVGDTIVIDGEAVVKTTSKARRAAAVT
jgi:3-hydroxybutyryl-CoA dehydratase